MEAESVEGSTLYRETLLIRWAGQSVSRVLGFDRNSLKRSPARRNGRGATMVVVVVVVMVESNASGSQAVVGP